MRRDGLIGLPQALRLVSDAVVRGRIRLGVRQIVAGAEVLEQSDAASIEAAFGVRLDQIYQATEGFLGITCHHGALHLNEDGLIFERRYIDRASGRFMPSVTDLWRSTRNWSCATGSTTCSSERPEPLSVRIVVYSHSTH